MALRTVVHQHHRIRRGRIVRRVAGAVTGQQHVLITGIRGIAAVVQGETQIVARDGRGGALRINVAPRAGARLDLAQAGTLHFMPPDPVRFPCLRLAREAGIAGSTYPTVLSAADDVAVAAFLEGRVTFPAIPAIIADVLDTHAPDGPVTIERILTADAWARNIAANLVKRHERP